MRRSNRLSALLVFALASSMVACADGSLADANPTATDSLSLAKRRNPKYKPPVLTPPPPVTPPPVASIGCVMQKADNPANVAFCDTFDQPAAVVTRSGDLNQTLWGVSRLNTHVNHGMDNDYYSTALVGCGTAVPVFAPRDVRICNGRVFESARDMEGQSTVALYPKQPFDFAGRTGTVAFDVSLDSQGPHAAWPEFWITDKPVPAPTDHRPGTYTTARNEFGISFSANCGPGYTGIDHISTVTNYNLVEGIPFTNLIPFTPAHLQCFKSGTATGELNHVEIRMSATHVDVWVTEPGSPTLLHAVSADVTMPLTKGLIWFVDAHYNANKFDTQGDHTFAWDNLVFDGPKTYRDLGFDVPDANLPSLIDPANARQLGYYITPTPVALQVTGIHRVQTPTGALVVFNYFTVNNGVVPSFRLNGGPWHETPNPFTGVWVGWRTIDVSVPVSEVVDGATTIEFKENVDYAWVSNISIILVAGAPVP